MFYVGLDVHTTQITVCVLNHEGKVTRTTISLGAHTVADFPSALGTAMHEMGHAIFNGLHGNAEGPHYATEQMYATEAVAEDFSETDHSLRS